MYQPTETSHSFATNCTCWTVPATVPARRRGLVAAAGLHLDTLKAGVVSGGIMTGGTLMTSWKAPNRMTRGRFLVIVIVEYVIQVPDHPA